MDIRIDDVELSERFYCDVLGILNELQRQDSTMERTQSNDALLRKTLFVNAGVSTVATMLLVLMPGTIGEFLGYNQPAVMLGIGVLLLLFWIPLVFWTALSRELRPPMVRLIIYGDFAWGLGSAVLLVVAARVFSSAGFMLISAAAVLVFVLAVLQQAFLQRMLEQGDA